MPIIKKGFDGDYVLRHRDDFDMEYGDEFLRDGGRKLKNGTPPRYEKSSGHVTVTDLHGKNELEYAAHSFDLRWVPINR